MKCAEALERLADYSAIPVNDPQRIAIDQHLIECEACAEQFVVWSVSEHWMEADESDFHPEDAPSMPVSRVMERIYDEQQWLMPVHRRSHLLSLRSRQIIAGIIAFCMAMFLCALVILFIHHEQANVHEAGEFISTALAGSDHSGFIELPIADHISESILPQVVPTIPHYWIALSLFGVTFTLLLLNWLIRVRQ